METLLCSSDDEFPSLESLKPARRRAVPSATTSPRKPSVTPARRLLSPKKKPLQDVSGNLLSPSPSKSRLRKLSSFHTLENPLFGKWEGDESVLGDIDVDATPESPGPKRTSRSPRKKISVSALSRKASLIETLRASDSRAFSESSFTTIEDSIRELEVEPESESQGESTTAVQKDLSSSAEQEIIVEAPEVVEETNFVGVEETSKEIVTGTQDDAPDDEVIVENDDDDDEPIVRRPRRQAARKPLGLETTILFSSDEEEESASDEATDESDFNGDSEEDDDEPMEEVSRRSPGKSRRLSVLPTSTPRRGSPRKSTVKITRPTKNSTPTPQLQDSAPDDAALLAESLSSLKLEPSQKPKDDSDSDSEFVTPASTPKKTVKTTGLVSPSKLARVPRTPHRPSTDAFWNREFIDDWNDEHSPKKLVLPPAKKSPVKALSAKEQGTEAKVTKAAAREAKQVFENKKHEIATSFLQELDTVITQGKLAELAQSTGGIQIQWTNKLNTTAGRANWRRETIRTRGSDSNETAETITHRHHASIELAEKVINDENRLLNVVAHEFCHLANFMVSNVTTNPHGREFKQWARKCSVHFASRGIDVTTKHTYDIAFKYVWECSSCGTEYKRHSRSIDPSRHRCGACKATLKQTKPVPRRANASASAYQIFVKENMRAVREANPGCAQKEVMRIVADLWSKESAARKAESSSGGSTPGSVSVEGSVDEVDLVAERLDVLALQAVDVDVDGTGM